MYSQVFPIPLSDCLPVLIDNPSHAAGYLCACMNTLGMTTHFERDTGGAKLTIRVNGNSGQVIIAAPELAGLPATGLPFRLGTSTAFGVPSGKRIEEEPEFLTYVPADFTVGQLVDLAHGMMSASQFTQLQNFSALHAMSTPRGRFPISILLMQGSRRKLTERGDQCFVLWTQTATGVKVYPLSGTGCPHQAAAEAADMGYHPTIYRCLSGQLITFKPTDGGVFIDTPGE